MDPIAQMNEEKDLILGDIFNSIKASRTHEFYIPADMLADCLNQALGDEAILMANKMAERYGMHMQPRN